MGPHAMLKTRASVSIVAVDRPLPQLLTPRVPYNVKKEVLTQELQMASEDFRSAFRAWLRSDAAWREEVRRQQVRAAAADPLHSGGRKSIPQRGGSRTTNPRQVVVIPGHPVPFDSAEEGMVIIMTPTGCVAAQFFSAASDRYCGTVMQKSSSSIVMRWNAPEEGGPPAALGIPSERPEQRGWWDGDGKPVTAMHQPRRPRMPRVTEAGRMAQLVERAMRMQDQVECGWQIEAEKRYSSSRERDRDTRDKARTLYQEERIKEVDYLRRLESGVQSLQGVAMVQLQILQFAGTMDHCPAH